MNAQNRTILDERLARLEAEVAKIAPLETALAKATGEIQAMKMRLAKKGDGA